MNKLKIGLLLIIYCANASAYVDPGSSLLLLQGLFALAGAVVVFVKNPLGSIKSLYGKWSSKPGHSQSGNAPDDA